MKTSRSAAVQISQLPESKTNNYVERTLGKPIFVISVITASS